MHHPRRKSSSSAITINGPPPMPTTPIELVEKEAVRTYSKSKKDTKALAFSSCAIALSIVSPSCDLSDAAFNGPGSSKESGWRTAYGAARMAVEITKESSDMFLPLKTVVGALAVLIRNYDQTTTNAEQIRDVEERIESLADVLASPVCGQDNAEKARRKALRKKLVRIIAKLRPLSEQHKLLKFLKNVDHAKTLSGFVQDLAYAVTDYQTSIQQNIYENTKEIGRDTRNIVEAADLELLGNLGAVHNAGHQAGHHNTCLRGTRESILDGIMQWAKDPQDRHVFWLNGLAGTGKSTIAQTFAGMIVDNGTLGASFFCSRDYLDRKELKNIFPTLAYQLACRYPAFRSRIIRTIKRDPSVARNSLTSQLKDLIVDPLSVTEISCVIVVDALDECVDDQPASAILSVLGRYVKQLPSVKFFITGRPEQRIRTGFRLPLLEPFTQIFLLHEVELSSIDEDIRLYLQEKLTVVAKRRSDFDLTDPWPRDEDLAALTKKSSGLFIFASTLIRFIESEYHEPNERLQRTVTLPDRTTHEGRAGIDPLYTQVLMHGFSDVKEAMVFENTKRVLGAVILAFNPLSRTQAAGILNIKPSLVTATLRHLHSVLLIPNEDCKEIRVFHKSFPDFLQDPDRCSNPKFFIASPVHHADMALGCLELLKKLKQNPCDLPDFAMNRDVANASELLEDKVGSALRYACAYWTMHVRSSPTDDDYATRLITSATEFFENNALPWIEVMSLENRLEDVIHSIHGLFEWLGTVDVLASNLYCLAEDCLRFTMHFFNLIQQSTPHIYRSALPLSPKSSMFYSMPLPEETRIAEFHGRPESWGSILRTIKGTSGGFTCMTTIGHGITARIAVACDDGTVGIYDSVTGVLKLSLSSPHPIRAITGSPDGSTLFCTHQKSPSITLWDIQTGGLVHTFTLAAEATDTTISLSGRYLACGLSDGVVNVWEVGHRTGGPRFRDGSAITCLCWLAPEERLMVATEASVHIRDVVTGSVLVHRFDIQDPVHHAVYSHKFDLLAVSGPKSSIAIIDPQTGTSSASSRFQGRLSCFAFSQTNKALVCGMKTGGLMLVNISPRGSTYFDFPAMITSVSTLSSGTVVANVASSGIQFLSLDKGYVPSQGLIPPTLTVYPLDKGKIIAIVPTDRDGIILLETATMSQVLTIPGQKNFSGSTDRTVVLCASLENKIAVHCSARGGKEYLQLWKFDSRYPRWTVQTNALSSTGCISPARTRLATFHDGRSLSYICVWDMHNGRLLVTLDVDLSPHPLDIIFDSEHLFHVNYDTYCVLYGVTTSLQLGTPTHSIDRLEKVSLDTRTWEKQYCVDDGREWVVSGSQRICWIPPGYIGSDQASYCWAGSSLVMAGQDGTLRKLVFLELSL